MPRYLSLVNEDIRKDGSCDIPEGIRFIGEITVYNSSKKIKSLTIPTTVTDIGDCAFGSLRDVEQINILGKVTSIGKWAFHSEKLKQIVLPVSANIHDEAFVGARSLQGIHIKGSNDHERANIVRLLSIKQQEKVVSKKLTEKIFKLIDQQLERIIKTPQTNPLYKFYNYNTYQEGGLPNNLFQHINMYLDNQNRYYQKAKTAINHVPLPIKEEEFGNYEKKIKDIVDACIQKAIAFHEGAQKKLNNYSFLLKTLSDISPSQGFALGLAFISYLIIDSGSLPFKLLASGTAYGIGSVAATFFNPSNRDKDKLPNSPVYLKI